MMANYMSLKFSLFPMGKARNIERARATHKIGAVG
jgi:hypothetical protein